METLTHQLFIATLVLIPFTLIIEQPWTLQPSLASVIALFASGWGTSIIALLLYYYLTERSYGPHQFHRGLCRLKHPPLRVIPINGVFWGALLLSEPVTASMIAALALILSGVILVNRAAAKKEKVEKVAVVSEE